MAIPDPNRKPQSYVDDETQTLKHVWEDADAHDLYAIQEMMYNQSRRPNETHDGKHWSKLFESNGAFMMTKVLMTLFQEKSNVQFDYSSMRAFLNSQFEIESPLPRHEKIEYPYEEHPDAVMREWQNKVSDEGLDPGSLGNEYDPNDPENLAAIEAAMAIAEQDIMSLDKEQIIAETKLAQHTSDVKDLADLMAMDMEFERICGEMDIDPHQFAVWKYDARTDAAAVPFEDAIGDLRASNKEEVERFFVKKTNEANGIFEDTAIPQASNTVDSELPTHDPIGGPATGDEPGLNRGGFPYDTPPSSGNAPGVAGFAPGSQPDQPSSGEGAKKTPPSMDIKDFIKQIQQQDQDKRAAEKGGSEGYNPKDPNERPRAAGYGAAPGMSIRLPFEDRISSLISGIVSYPGSKYRMVRDSAITRKRVVESRSNLMSEISHISNNFQNMTDNQKKTAVERIRDTIFDYQKDVKDAVDVSKATGDSTLKRFLNDETKHADAIKKAMTACANNIPELEDLKKFFDSVMEAVRNLMKSLGNVLGKGSGAGSPSPSP